MESAGGRAKEREKGGRGQLLDTPAKEDGVRRGQPLTNTYRLANVHVLSLSLARACTLLRSRMGMDQRKVISQGVRGKKSRAPCLTVKGTGAPTKWCRGKGGKGQ